MQKRKQKKPPPTVVLTLSDTDAGIAWLNSLAESEFRDRVLGNLFVKMKKAGLIEEYKNVHGRNDKGVDYLVAQKTPLQRSVIGIQVKSKRITRTGDSSSLSSLDLKTECVAALTHQYDFQGDKVRLDNVAIWTSAHITEDAEKEFSAPGNTAKIQVRKPESIYALIHEHCPDLLARVPQCSLSVYLREKATPEPKSIKLLGKSLDPRKDFLVPTISTQAASASSRLSTRNNIVQPNTDTISIESLLERTSHAIIQGNDLSGKTYLLEHLQAVAAEAAMLPFLLNPEHFASKPRTIFHVLAKILPSFSPNDFEQMSKKQRLFVLVDDFDKLEETYRELLLKLDPNDVTILGTAKTISARNSIELLYIVGVELDSIAPFLRSLDLQRDTVFTDRAHSFIRRSLAHSGLPETPFTVAMLLQECQVSPSKFTTPTMGRLIERFIELQLGSHSEDRTLVDFETKREFLTRLAGRAETSISQQDLRKRLAKHVHTRSLPHDPELFLLDLMQGGVFSEESDGSVTWGHPIIKQYFWVKNLLANRNTRPIEKILRERPDSTLAAIVGSQLSNAGNLIKTLVDDLAHLQMPSRQDLINAVREMAPDVLPTAESEAQMLEDIEKVATDEKVRRERRTKVASVTSQYQLTDGDRKRVEKNIGPLMQEVIQSKLHIGQNLSAVVVNARDTKSAEKELAVRQILLSNGRMGRLFQEMLLLMYEGRPRVLQIASWLRIYLTLSHTDTLLGDPFLLPVFRHLLRQRLDDESNVMLLDLVLGCSNENTDAIVAALQNINQPEITQAIYFRVVSLYFFRFHREKEGKTLRRLLAELRRIHPFAALPSIRSPS